MSPCIGRLFCARARKYSTRWVGEVRMNIFQYRPATQLAVVQPPPFHHSLLLPSLPLISSITIHNPLPPAHAHVSSSAQSPHIQRSAITNVLLLAWASQHITSNIFIFFLYEIIAISVLVYIVMLWWWSGNGFFCKNNRKKSI